MAYNKAREEKKWRLWKEAEEKQLRKQRMQEAGTYLEGVADDTQQPEIKTVEDFLNSIENQQLYQIAVPSARWRALLITSAVSPSNSGAKACTLTSRSL